MTDTLDNESSGRYTSDEFPYKMSEIAHFDDFGRIYIGMCPGKKDTRWNRDVATDLAMIRRSGVNVIVCLLEWSEFEKLKLGDYSALVQNDGFFLYHFPIVDMNTPSKINLHVFIPIIADLLSKGNNVLIHCRSGLGRAGTITACVLVHFGYTPGQAIEIVRENRPGAIQTVKQEQCVVAYGRQVAPDDY